MDKDTLAGFLIMVVLFFLLKPSVGFWSAWAICAVALALYAMIRNTIYRVPRGR